MPFLCIFGIGTQLILFSPVVNLASLRHWTNISLATSRIVMILHLPTISASISIFHHTSAQPVAHDALLRSYLPHHLTHSHSHSHIISSYRHTALSLSPRTYNRLYLLPARSFLLCFLSPHTPHHPSLPLLFDLNTIWLLVSITS